MTNIELQTLSAIKAAAQKIANPDIDWEQRRYELVKEIVPAMLQNKNNTNNMVVINQSIALADDIITALRKKV